MAGIGTSEESGLPSFAFQQVPWRIRTDATQFVGRAWLLPEVSAWLDDPDQRLLLLLGEPGSGKSTICGWLAGAGPAPDDPGKARMLSEIARTWNAVHFCSRRWEGASTDARTFTHSLTTQFARSDPDFATAALRTLPGGHEINVQVALNLGEVVGVRAKHLWLAGLGTSEIFAAAVLDPLRLLLARHPQRRLAIMVDGVDEAVGLGSPSILDLVASLRDLSAGLKVLVTAKRDRRVRDVLAEMGALTEIDLSGPRFRPAHASDLAAYIKKRMTTPSVHRKGAHRNWSVPELATAAGGSFQYARLWFDDRDRGKETKTLPHGLADLYKAHLERLMPRRRAYGTSLDWADSHALVLGLIAIALEPMSVSTVARILGKSETRVRALTDDLQQVVDLGLPAEDPKVRFFHFSLAEFIARPTLDTGEVNPYFIPSAASHRSVVDFYLDGRNPSERSWSDCDRYGLLHLAEHISIAHADDIPHAAGLLHDLLTRSDFPQTQKAVFDSSEQTARDYRRAFDLMLASGRLSAARELVGDMIRIGDPFLSGTAVSLLVKLYARQPRKTQHDIIALLSESNAHKVRVGLNAAGAIGLQAEELFLWIALSADEDVRKQSAFITYIQWTQGDKERVTDFLRLLTRSVRLRSPKRALRLVRYLMDASIALYTSQCHDRELVHTLDELWYELLVRRMRLNWINQPMLQRALQRLSTASSLSDRVLDAMLLDDLQPARVFFEADPAERDAFNRCVGLLRPDSDLAARWESVHHLLASPVLLLRMLGSLIVGVHAVRDPAATSRLVRRHVAGMAGRARMWLLIGFSVHAPTPPEFLETVHHLTHRLLAENYETIVGRDSGELSTFNVFLLPVGLASGRTGLPMEQVDRALCSALKGGDDRMANAIINGLGFVGIYSPDTTLTCLLPAMHTASLEVESELTAALASMAALHPDQVDLFLLDVGRQDLVDRVRGAVDIQRTRQQFDRIGHFNNAINQAARHSVMRENLLIPALENLGRARLRGEYFSKPSGVLNLLRVHNYHVIEWATEETSKDSDARTTA
ncbi:MULTISPECIES: hypothetical protein [unclassified Streptomyces]|uniref:hypothetical protein n=1 Tax=unclassified Streptomyces TaxID=2593676 RepID=UPI00369FA653